MRPQLLVLLFAVSLACVWAYPAAPEPQLEDVPAGVVETVAPKGGTQALLTVDAGEGHENEGGRIARQFGHHGHHGHGHHHHGGYGGYGDYGGYGGHGGYGGYGGGYPGGYGGYGDGFFG